MAAAMGVSTSGRMAVVVVDPMSTGAFLAPIAISQGYSVICVYSSDELGDFKTHVPAEAADVKFAEVLTHSGDTNPEKIKHTAALLQQMGYEIVACLAGAECGVEVGEALAEALNLRGNGTALSACRRNKYLMGERVRECGLRAVKQMKGSAASWDEIEAFLDREAPTPFRMVVKPLDSCGSDGVYKCCSKDEVREACDAIVGHCNATGSFNSEVLVQEFLSGIEYVVDSVSKDGQHKVVAVWEYDKRAVNGAPFVYFGMRLLDPQCEVAQQLINYMAGSGGVLDALGFQNGPGHAEVKMEADGPCLVEVGARCHGWSGTWLSLVKECVDSYNQVEATMDVYLNKGSFDSMPQAPHCLLKHGTCVMLVSREEGTLTSVSTNLLEALPSFHKANLGHCHVGENFPKTIDLFTSPGQVLLAASSAAQLEADYAFIHEVSELKLFSVA
jgi:biotin carboxylase